MATHRIHELIRTPIGRLLATRDPGEAKSTMSFQTRLVAEVRNADGKLIDQRKTLWSKVRGPLFTRDLGSGLVTNVGVNMMANEASWVAAATPFATVQSMNFHAIGTGTTAAAAADYNLQTAILAASLTGSTNGYMTGSQSVVNPNIYQTVATFTANGSLAVTEWVIAMSNAANFTRTSAGAAPTQTTFTDTGATFTTAGNALKGWTIEIAATAINTPTTTAQALILSNTATVLTLAPGPDSTHWWSLANASVAAPGATIAYVVYPTIFDHKVFSAINLVATNTLQLTYQLTVTSGG